MPRTGADLRCSVQSERMSEQQQDERDYETQKKTRGADSDDGTETH